MYEAKLYIIFILQQIHSIFHSLQNSGWSHLHFVAFRNSKYDALLAAALISGGAEVNSTDKVRLNYFLRLHPSSKRTISVKT